MWMHGIINGAHYEAKVFEEGSQFGINGGRVSKLHIVKDGRCILNYDRGWDIEPTTDEAREALRMILKFYA
jgi:hypothetical protein